ncbi:MAD2L1-binding protein-like [Actinia tenebrosa]|uniref:MAD2L1-binding protein-like n=1 Tax=Actinia tenebrosa TaxID=6105 RepID=A0A6P8I0Q9_ACTTE|nr:MAD2L1-binding protein-like [Actinia tenebrosa]
MAAKMENSSELKIDFVLGEHDSNAAKGKIVIECIKYLLYERHQVPTTVDQILRYTELEMAEGGRNVVSRRPTVSSRNDSKKRIQLYNDLKCLFQNVEHLFSSSTVSSVVLVFGSTAVSPKESYVINFQTNVNSIKGSNDIKSESSQKRLSRKLIRTLVMNQELRSFKEISSTPLLVFVRVPRSVENSWFKPKQSFKIPWRGNFCRILVKDTEMTEEEEAIREEDLVWLQAPVPIKGYNEKVKDASAVYSDFWN